MDEHETPFVHLAVRTFLDPASPEDVAEVNRLQDQVAISSNSARPFTHPEYDSESLDATRKALLALSQGLRDSDRMFGNRLQVEPTRHLMGTALGWGGLPENEAYYYVESEPMPAGRYTFTFGDVPVDGFWSVTIYNRDGYLEPNPYNSFSLNGVTSQPEPDGTVVLILSPEGEGLKNHLYVMDGWNYLLRLYKPHQSVLDETWTPPTPQPVS